MQDSCVSDREYVRSDDYVCRRLPARWVAVYVRCMCLGRFGESMTAHTVSNGLAPNEADSGGHTKKLKTYHAFSHQPVVCNSVDSSTCTKEGLQTTWQTESATVKMGGGCAEVKR